MKKKTDKIKTITTMATFTVTMRAHTLKHTDLHPQIYTIKRTYTHQCYVALFTAVLGNKKEIPCPVQNDRDTRALKLSF